MEGRRLLQKPFTWPSHLRVQTAPPSGSQASKHTPLVPHQMRTICTLILVNLAALFCAAVAAGEDQALLSYSHEGGHSPIKKLEVIINGSGKADVTIHKHSTDPQHYQTTLSQLELDALDTLIESTGFFTLPEGGTEGGLERLGVRTTITISKQSNSKTMVVGSEPELLPLGGYIGRLLSQATAIGSINADVDIYTATGAVNRNLAGAKALQPDRLREPLISYVRRSKDTQCIGWALEALGCILTPEELVGLIASEVKLPNRQPLFLFALPGSVSKEHTQALCLLYLSYIRDNLPRRNELTSQQQNAFDGFLAALGDARYEPAIPLLKTLLDKATQSSLHPDVIPLAKMGTAGLYAVIPYLESPNAIHRSYAIELFQIAARGNPKSKYANPYSAWEYQQMVPLFKDRIIVRLREVLEKDPSPDIRAKAETALAEIASEIAK